MTQSELPRRVLYLPACLAVAWAAIAMMWGGVVLTYGSLRFASRDPLRPFLVGLAAAAYYAWRVPRTVADADGAWLGSLFRRSARIAVPLLVLATLGIGILYGSFAAGGSDSYGYVSQARLWLAGTLRLEQPWVDQMSWPDREWTFAPLGYRPVRATSTLVPTYPAGLPILMAGFERVFGSNGPFLVVPVIGALAVWLTYALGREVSRHRSVRALAALLLVASPVFLAHVMLPMTDVPVAAGWTLVWLLALREPPRALAAGLAAGATLLVRPNLLPLIFVPLAAWIWPCIRGLGTWRLYSMARGPTPATERAPTFRAPSMRDAAFYGAGTIPGFIAVAAINYDLYGSAFVLRYDWLPLQGLDPVIDELKKKGYRPYILLEEWEEPEFRARFGPLNSAGRLDWPPVAEIAGSVRVRLYDPDSRAAALK